MGGGGGGGGWGGGGGGSISATLKLQNPLDRLIGHHEKVIPYFA